MATVHEKMHPFPTGLKLLVGFFLFGTAMVSLTLFLLAFPGTALDSLWRLNPDAHDGFQLLGKLGFLFMAVVGSSCAAAAVGLARRAEWGRITAIVVLAVNLLGDLLNALVRQDYRALIGLPIGGALIAYLCRRRVRDFFKA